MSAAQYVRFIVIFVGVLILWLDFWNYSKKNLTDKMSLLWGIFSVLVIIAGLVPWLWRWASIHNERIYILFALVILCIVIGLFAMSVSVSKLQMKNQELAIHISLLNEENSRVLQELRILTGKAELEL